MILTIATSGGIGGFGLGRDARVEVASLPAAVQGEVCAAFAADRLRELAKAPAAPGADRLTYTIAVGEQDGSLSRFDIAESAIPGDMLDLIDTFMAGAD